jgi:hypothetical protein
MFKKMFLLEPTYWSKFKCVHSYIGKMPLNVLNDVKARLYKQNMSGVLLFNCLSELINV